MTDNYTVTSQSSIRVGNDVSVWSRQVFHVYKIDLEVSYTEKKLNLSEVRILDQK